MDALPPITYLWTQHRIYSCYKFLTLDILVLVAASHAHSIHRFRHFSTVPDILLSLIPATTWDLQWFFITLIFTLLHTHTHSLCFLSMAGEYSETKLTSVHKTWPWITTPFIPRLYTTIIPRIIPEKPWLSLWITIGYLRAWNRLINAVLYSVIILSIIRWISKEDNIIHGLV